METAMAGLIDRHPGLRVQLGEKEGRPYQRILDSERPALEVVDLDLKETIEDRARALSREPFRLDQEAPLRFVLFRRQDEDPALIWLFHHVAIDFWSIGILVQELDTLYRAARTGHPTPLPEIDATYDTFVDWQEKRLSGGQGERLRTFWMERLKGLEPGSELPLDRPRPAELTFRGGTRRCDVDADLTAALRKVALQSRTTLFTSLLAAVLTLLGKLSGRRQVLLGTPVAGRSQASFHGVVGYFVNLLPLSGEVGRGTSFTELLGSLSAEVVEALDHGDLPFAEMVEGLGLRRDPSRAPLCDVGFALESSKMDRMGIVPLLLGEAGARTEIGGLVCEGLAIPQQEGQFDLNFHFLETQDGLAGLAMFNADLFDTATVDRWCGHLETLLKRVLRAPDAPLDQISLLEPVQRHQLALEWQSSPSLPAAGTVVDLFRKQARQTPGAVALEGDEEGLTYRELDRRTDQLALLLNRLGVGAETVVGVCLESSPDLVIAELAVLKAQGAYLPLDPSYPEERRAFMLEDGGAFAVLTSAEFARGNQEDRTPVWRLEELLQKSIPTPSEEGLGEVSGLSLQGLAYVIYTSGSTGRPKGVAVPHSGLPNLLRWHQRLVGVGPGDRLSSTSGPSFDPSGLEIWSALTAGATVLFPPREARISGRRFARWLEAEGVTVGSAPTPLAEAFLGEEHRSESKLKSLFLGGDRLATRPGKDLPFHAFNFYGPTETTVVAAGGRVRVAMEGLPAPSIGRPIDGVTIHLLDQAHRSVSIGAVGELWIGGVGVARGYVGRPAQTAASFLPDSFSEIPGQRLYRTGDTARWSVEGRLLFLGRQDHQVKIRGVRIELGEIESALQRLPGVSSAVVQDRESGPGGRSLVAYIVPTETALDVRKLRQELEETLPPAMIPSHFIELDELPLTANGKVDRRALPEPLRASQQESLAESLQGTGLEEGGLEGKVAEVWSSVLGIPSVPPEANFFDLGGHSLLLGELLVQLEDVLDRSLTVVQLLRYPTVRSLARFLSPGLSGPSSSGSSALRSASEPAFSTTEPVAVIGMSCRYPGAPDVEAFWDLLVEGREGLRRLSEEGGEGKSSFVPVAGDLVDIELFDAKLFGLNPREAEILDPQQRLFLECAWEALEDAGSPPDSENRTGVFAGTARSSYLDRHLSPRRNLVEEVGDYQLSLSNDKDFLPTRVSYLLGLKGPSVNVQTACSTSLTAVHLACQSLRLGECDQALAGGVAVRLPQAEGYHFQEGMILSPDGHCRAFDAEAAGTVGANGAGVVLLKPLSRAIADGDSVRAVILGSAMNNDGALKVGYTAPSVDGQVDVLQAAYRAAGADPETVRFVEAHGTGTELGDPIEVAALNEVFGGKAKEASIGLGSVKTNLGHLDAAAGVAGLMKAVLSLERGMVPPSLHFSKPNPKIEFDAGPFSVVREAQPILRASEPCRAGVSSFGIGGTNVHVVLEQPPEPVTVSTQSETQEMRPELLVLSGQSREAVNAGRSNLAESLESLEGAAKLPKVLLKDVAWTLQTGRRAFEERFAVVVGRGEEAASVLKDPSRHLEGRPVSEVAPVFLFPGQGAQHPRMAYSLSQRIPSLGRSLERCSEILAPSLGLDLRELLTASGVEAATRLRQTEVAQPLLFALELSLAQLWRSLGVNPQGMLCHSVGELVAACMAGVFSEEEGLHLMAARGRLIQSLPKGGMLGVSLSEEEVRAVLPPTLALAAVNGPAACVVSGPSEEIEKLARKLAEQDVEHRGLHTSHAFHSSMMEPALDDFRRELEGISLGPPKIPFVSNVTGTWIRPEEATDPEYWVRHLRGTVRFADGLLTVASRGTPLFLEVGPGKTLGTFARRTIAGARIVSSLPHPKQAERDEEVFLEAIARLWLSGAPIAWEKLEEERAKKVSLPAYPFQRKRYWIEPPLAAELPATEGAPPLSRTPEEEWLYRPTWIAAEPVSLGSSLSGEGLWLLFLDRSGLGVELAESLRGRGRVVVEVQPEDGVDLDRVFSSLPHPPSRIVHLGAYGDSEDFSERSLEDGFFSLAALASKVAKEGLEVRIEAVTSAVFRVLPEDRVIPPRAAVLGPLRVLPQERPGVKTRILDLPMPEARTSSAILNALETELEIVRNEHAEHEVTAWRRGQRWQQRFEAVSLKEPKARRKGAVVLITGGLGGVGLEIARHLASQGSVRLALLSRRGVSLPGEAKDQERHKVLAELRAAGAEVEVVAADVTDRQSLATGIETIQARFGRIDGVIHAAGVAGGTMLEVLERDVAAEVLAAKVDGTRNLVDLVPPRKRDFFLLCSSLSALLGGLGQAAYCSANAVLDGFAEFLFEDGVTSVAWDLWRNIGMALPSRGPGASSRELKRNQDEGMSALEARNLLDRLLACGLPRVIVSTLDLEARRAAQPMKKSEDEEVSQEPGHDRPALATPYVPPRSQVEEALAEIWGSLLGIRRIGAHDDFFELGGHSLLGTRVLSRVADQFGVELSLSTLFQQPTVAGLATELDQQTRESPSQESSDEDRLVELEALDATAMAALLESMEAVEVASK